MAPKRPRPSQDGEGREGERAATGDAGQPSKKKHARADLRREARVIPTQAQPPVGAAVARSSPALAVGGAGASPSPTTTPRATFPPSLDVEQFAEARNFEIKAMKRAMKNALDAGAQRAWQSLPRHLRRRAASHNVKRLPVRLREKALAENAASHINKPADTKDKDANAKKKKTKEKSSSTRTQRRRKEELQSRQRKDRKWLETHLWHAKRMHMQDRWAYRLALSPTEKVYRASYRASAHDVILHDASYFNWIRLEGKQEHLKGALTVLCGAESGVAGARYIHGSRLASVCLYGPSPGPAPSFPRPVCPADVLWVPRSSPSDDERDADDPIKARRTVFIRVHPAASDEAFRVCLSACQLASTEAQSGADVNTIDVNHLDAEKLHEEQSVKVEKVDGFNCFEIVGPRAAQVLGGVLKVVKAEETMKKKAFRSITACSSPALIPRGLLLGLEVYDPRLSFPPKVVKQGSITAGNDGELSFALNPSVDLAHSKLLKEGKGRPAFTKGEIDSRRSQQFIPGSRLIPKAQDDRVPVLIAQHTLSSSESSSCNALRPYRPPRADSPTSFHGFTIFLPRHWALPFWLSLVQTGAKIAGIEQRRQQHFEAGLPSFPWDWVGTRAWRAEEGGREKEERRRWESKPPAKRASWSKLGTEHPFGLIPAFDQLITRRLQTWAAEQRGEEAADLEGGGVVAKWARQHLEVSLSSAPGDSEGKDKGKGKGKGKGKEVDSGSAECFDRVWPLRGPKIPTLLQRLVDVATRGSQGDSVSRAAALATLLSEEAMSMSSCSRTSTEQEKPKVDLGMALDTLSTAVVQVRIVPVGKGAFTELGIVYALSEELEERWREAVVVLEKEGKGKTPDETGLRPEQAIGYVTTGDYSLSQGRGSALGCVSLCALIDLMARHRQRRVLDRLVAVRNRESVVCRPARLEVLG